MEFEQRETDRLAEPATPEAVSMDRSPLSAKRPALGGLISSARLSVGPVGDPVEREADATADRVVRMLNQGASGGDVAQGDSPHRVQRAAVSSGRVGDTAMAEPRVRRAALPSITSVSSGRQATVRRMAAEAADIDGATVDGDGPIFDSKVESGIKFRVESASAGTGRDAAIAAYIDVIRPVGTRFAGEPFIDQELKFAANAPTRKTWPQRGAAFVTEAEAELGMDRGDGGADFASWSARIDDAHKRSGNRASLLRDPTIKNFIDPFLLDVVITDPQHGSWHFLTQFAHSGLCYIVKIVDAQGDITGEIAEGVQGRIGGVKQSFRPQGDDQVKAADDNYLYSSTHEQSDTSFGDRMAGLADPQDGDVKGKYHSGLDAMTVVAAEGARFAPIAALGAAGSTSSHYFVKPNVDWSGYKFMTQVDLFQSWKTDFHARYGITTATVRDHVAAHGRDDVDQPPPGHHFDLSSDQVHDEPAPGGNL